MNNVFFPQSGALRRPSPVLSLLPIIFLLVMLVGIIASGGAELINTYSPVILLSAAALSLLLGRLSRSYSARSLRTGFQRSAVQILPAVPMLLCISMVATTWMLSGVVPTLIVYGLNIINPTCFLVITCAVCGAVSVLTGSSWSTIATIGVAFMGIGTVLGYSEAWIAGAIISGAYFGDKMSPLSDTTVVASSACGVDLFKHIRYMMLTSVPAMAAALAVYGLVGLWSDHGDAASASEITGALHSTFNISAWTLVIPAVTVTLLALRVPTLWVLAAGAATGTAGIFLFQPHLLPMLEGNAGHIAGIARTLWQETSLSTGSELLDSLAGTSGITGMLPTIWLVLSAMVFGAAMI
ncbi:MAG: sodium:proton antiporter, partial [Muribaculaceae bacterium]|nr:sodium:proton antiporter [Muribaculaceae bacterium]